jgi:flavin reductase (DIM6/NTAB) family NADH-FMN oxidoreductase RutF
MTLDTGLYKQIMARWASGVSVVTTMLNNEPHGMTASSFASVSLEPMLVLVNVGKKQQTHSRIEQTGSFAVNILREDQAEWGKLFAGMLPDRAKQFIDIAYTTAVTGSPILPDSSAWLDCQVYRAYEGGDHTIFVGEVVAGNIAQSPEPLLYFNRSWGTFSAESAAGLTHIVMFRLHEPTDANLTRLRDALLSLKSKISEIRSMEVGKNMIPSERAYDLALTMRFDSVAALQAYQTHPEHVKVLTEVIRPLASAIVATDYES